MVDKNFVRLTKKKKPVDKIVDINEHYIPMQF